MVNPLGSASDGLEVLRSCLEFVLGSFDQIQSVLHCLVVWVPAASF